MKLLNEFVIKGSPSTVTAQQRGERVVAGRIHHYKKANVKHAEAILSDQLLRYVPDEPYKGAIRLRLLWLFDKKSLTKSQQRSFKLTRPDLDNLYKGLADVMTDMGFWEDDSQVVSLDLTKGWSREFPGLFFQIWNVDENGDYTEIIEDWRNRT